MRELYTAEDVEIAEKNISHNREEVPWR